MKPIRQAQGKRVYSGIRGKKKSQFYSRQKTNSLYFDDCYVCQATKKAEKEGKDLSVEELTEIFRKANEQN